VQRHVSILRELAVGYLAKFFAALIDFFYSGDFSFLVKVDLLSLPNIKWQPVIWLLSPHIKAYLKTNFLFKFKILPFVSFRF
jgi:hypothetical protein